MVTLSLIAAVGLRAVITGDRVVANERDRSLAFQAAESAGREAIEVIKNPNRLIATHADYHPYLDALPLGGNANHWRTTSSLTVTDCTIVIPLTDAATKRYNWTTEYESAKPYCSTATKGAYGNKDKPRYFVELMPGAVATGGQTECWYRVTSRATGGTSDADVILQVMVSNTITGSPGDCK